MEFDFCCFITPMLTCETIYLAILCEIYGDPPVRLRTVGMRQVLSSGGIQRRFREIRKRNMAGIDPDQEIPDDSVSGGVPAAKTADNATETPVIVTETPVSAAITPANGNGNENKMKTTTQHGKSNEAQFSKDNGESARWEELIRMAKEATRGC